MVGDRLSLYLFIVGATFQSLVFILSSPAGESLSTSHTFSLGGTGGG